MSKDSGIAISTLHVDGGMTRNEVFMQIQSDILGMPIGEMCVKVPLFFQLFHVYNFVVVVHTVRPHMVETTALGAAMAAGVAVGVWKVGMSRSSEEMTLYSPSTTSDGM